MAKSSAVWGIDIGQCALKALCCRPHEKDENRIVVEAFDYIEYSKILTQPEADREELIREALQTFLSRNDVKDHSVAISVPGQSGLARFIKLPPVEAKKIPDIVKYEARQQIPFALDDVVWDYQPLIGKSEEGYALETEVGIFAMKRDQVARILEPLDQAGIAVDLIQLAPLALYNFLCFDRLGNLESADSYDPDNPPPSIVLISLGTDTTDLVITNGFRVWQRNIPIGGNHFTKALTKELRLTFSKAEHLKRNATKAEDPKAVFQAMRPVFSDLVAEIQRSIGFFTSNNRKAKLGQVLALGNPVKLPGLLRFLSQNLDQEVKPVDQFPTLMGGSATAGPRFQENQLSFAVSYGLCLQALGRSQIHTNLLPDEIVTTRLVRAKKPWAVAAAALLLVGIVFNYASHYSAWRSALTDKDPEMSRAIQQSKSWSQQAQSLTGRQTELTAKFDEIKQIGESLHSNVDGRLLWLELMKALDAALPKDPRPQDEREQTPEDVQQRPELHIVSLDCEYRANVSGWFSGVRKNYQDWQSTRLDQEKAAEAAKPPAAETESDNSDENADVAFVEEETYAEDSTDPAMEEDGSGESGGAKSPSGPGWIIQLVGYHFHNSDLDNEGGKFVNNTIVTNLEEGSVQLPDGPNGEMVDVPFKELGISFPVLVTSNRILTVPYTPDSTGADATGERSAPAGPGIKSENWRLRQYDFVVQFVWQPNPRTQRLKKNRQRTDELRGTASAGEADVDGIGT
jgi:type IV pilus assembly protein PilM